MKEALEKACHDMGFACDGLREALNKANNVEGLMVLKLIEQANRLRVDVEGLLAAHVADRAKE